MASNPVLADYVRVSKYALHRDGRRETWPEQVERVFTMHLEYYGDALETVMEYVDHAREMMLAWRALGSQRALQFGGRPIVRRHQRIYNCFRRDTEFVTRDGVRSFNDYEDGDRVSVRTHTGLWNMATVRNHGRQPLNAIRIQRGRAFHTVYATADHRWLTPEGGSTTSLREGDTLLSAPEAFHAFVYDDADPMERLYWAYGFVYGDGTRVKDSDGVHKYSMVRLCGHDTKYAPRFEELGFKTSSSASLAGDIMAYTGTYLKTAPDPSVDSPAMIKAFVAGYLDADGEKAPTASPRKFLTIQTSDRDHAVFIRRCFPIAGVYLVSEADHAGEETNFGNRGDFCVRFRIVDYFSFATNHKFRAANIEETGIEEDVWCLEVENDHSFVLPFGLVTGNCTVSHVNRPRMFQEAYHLLLCGSGVGFSVQTHHVDRLPNIAAPTGDAAVYQIPDTIEGWADAYGVLLSSYFVDDQPFPEYAGRPVTFDASLVRPKGAPISSGSKAPGPGPLLHALEEARLLLNRVIGEKGEVTGQRVIGTDDGRKVYDMIGLGLDRLRAIDAFDLIMFSADSVLSGGVRRSATIALFSPDDPIMVEAKAFPKWYDLEPQRKRANISAVLLRDSTDFETFVGLVERTKRWGEPGFIWSDDLEQLFNPCGEAGMCPRLEVETVDRASLLPGSWSGVEYDAATGLVLISGWQFCNLSTMNGSVCDTPEKFFEACRAAATLGTLQAGYTTFEYLGWVSEEIVRKEALLGVSMTGMMDQPDVLFDPATLERGAAIVKETNEIVAAALGINPAARTTLIKPEGKSSLILDTLAAGIHPWHSTQGIRHVRASVLESPFQHFKTVNPQAVFRLETSDPNYENTEVIAFTYQAPEGALTAKDVGAMDLLERVILVRKHWIEPGTRPERCVRPWLRHNVSNTITVQSDEWEGVTRFIFDNRDHFAGVAMLPAFGDKFYHLAPNVAAIPPEEQWEVHGLDAVDIATTLVDGLPESFGGLWPACDIVVNGNGGQHPSAEVEWMHSFETFAQNHFKGDFRVAEVCVKDVEVWRRFVFLRDSFRPVDWNDMDETTDEVDFGRSSGCDGQKCEIDYSLFEGNT